MATKIIKAWIDGAIQNIEVEEMTSPEQPLSVEERVDTLEGKHEVAISKGSMLVGDGTPELKEITPSEVLEHINAMGFATTTEEEYDALYKDDYNTNVLYMLTDGDDRADWSQTDETAESYIKNKPDIDGIVNDLNIRIDETKESIKLITPESIGAAASEHDHDDKYYTEFEIDEQLNLKSNVGHTHNSIIEVNKNVEQKFWRGTQSEYDALSNKSDDTMYIVIDGNDENTIVGLPNVNTAHDGKYLKVVNGTWVVDNSNYTDAEKKKLAGIADGATKTIIDTSLTQSGQAADAKTVGDALSKLSGGNAEDGFSPIANVEQTATGAVISITDKNGKTTATITNGKDGADGQPGKDGKDGADGAPGEKGDKGDKGDPGEPGQKGEQGIQGVPGEKGDKGETGAPGADGAKGEKGDKGDKGDTGEPGKDGKDGADGKSAYEYAQDGGYTGTEEEFAEKLAEDPSVFYITVTGNDTDGYTLDKTGEEIEAAYAAGRRLCCNLRKGVSPLIDALPLFYRNTIRLPVGEGFAVSKYAYNFKYMSWDSTTTVSFDVTHEKNTVVNIKVTTVNNYNEFPLTINDQEYDGSKAVTVDTREFVFTATGNMEDGYTIDATPDDIYLRILQGQTVKCLFNGEMISGFYLPLLMISFEDRTIYFGGSPMIGMAVTLMIMRDGSVGGEEILSAIQIGEQYYDFYGGADFTETINAMIDAKKAPGIIYIVGDSTTDGVWTGTSQEITEYFDGLTVAYKTNVAGVSGGSTLNVNGLGAIPVKRNADTAVTTTYPVGSVILLTYSDGSWLTADYDANTKTTTGTSNKAATKLFLTGATSQTSSGTTTYTNTKCYVGTDNRLYSNGEVVPNVEEITALIAQQLGVIENGTY